MVVIAEAGVNHDGEIEVALALVDAAADAGADIVKFQTFRADDLVAPGTALATYQQRDAGTADQLLLLRRLELPGPAFAILRDRATARGITFLSTPFDRSSVDLLEEFGVPGFKIASSDLVDHLLLAHVARKGRPLILSTGGATLGEVADALRVCAANGDPPVVLLHCVSAYPADAADANLRALDVLRREFGVPVGFSDHTVGLEVPLAAAALGACVIEKHLTLDRRRRGPDHAASSEPDEFAALVRGVRVVHSALGRAEKVPTESEAEVRRAARRSLALLSDVPAGTLVTEGMLISLRPEGGIPPADVGHVLGRRTTRPLKAHTFLAWSDLE